MELTAINASGVIERGDALAAICSGLPFDEGRKLRALASAVEQFIAAADKAACVERIRPALELAGVRGVSVPSMYRKAAAYKAAGVAALADGRAMRRVRGETGVASNKPLMDHWHVLCAKNRRKTAPAFRALVEQLRSGWPVPGVGTWQDAWAADHGGVRPPDGMPCPYAVGGLLPEGWSRIPRLRPDAFALAASRTGMMAAAMSALPAVIRTRAGLAPMEAVQIDDMWHEVKVVYAKNKSAQRVVEIKAVDVLTGHVVAWLAKPVRERDDGTRETLRGEWTRYLVAHLLCDVGIVPAKGCLIMGEHGTATLPPDVQEILRSLTGGKVRFGAGGLLSQPLAQGLPGGAAKGNPRYKGIVEGLHALVKNELGATRGHIGGGRGFQPEDAAALDRADRDLRQLALAVEPLRPGVTDRIRSSYLTFADYMALVGAAYDRIDTRTDHGMESWEECGFLAAEWRPSADSPWLPMAALDGMAPEVAEAFRSSVMQSSQLFRARRLSPREAWASRARELAQFGPEVAVAIMGESLAQLCTVSGRLMMSYRDESTSRKISVAAQLTNGVLLERGRAYCVWVNPFGGSQAYVADDRGRFLGLAPIMDAATYGDDEAIRHQLGIRQQALAAEKRRLAPIIRARLSEASQDAEANARAILGADPLEEDVRRQSVADALRGAGKAAVEDLILDKQKTDKVDIDDLI